MYYHIQHESFFSHQGFRILSVFFFLLGYPCCWIKSVKKNIDLKNNLSGAGELAQQLRAQTVLPEIVSSNPSNHMVTHNHL